MKCPHCGMNIRDNTVVCGYCGENVGDRPEKGAARAGSPKAAPHETVPKAGKAVLPAGEDEQEEEEGGLSAVLRPGEKVLIGSLNISVKKFFFHAYLTNQRIFLIDTQEKKLRVTAKDIPRETIVGSSVESSENSDPVLVLSIKSADDDIKTMKLVFVQNGMDRATEIDEWISLITEEKRPSGPARQAEEPARKAEEPEFARPERQTPARQEIQPVRKPAKDHEKQPPVKKLLSLYKVPEEEREEKAPEPVRRAQVRQLPESPKKPAAAADIDREPVVSREPDAQPVRKPEVQSAMKGAVKSAIHPVRHPAPTPVRRAVSEPATKAAPEAGPQEIVRRSVVQEKAGEKMHEYRPVSSREHSDDLQGKAGSVPEEPSESPQFCHHCGKKLPHAANFCPGCGTKLAPQRPSSPPQSHRTIPHKEKPVVREDRDDEDEDLEGERPVPAKPPVKKAPRGSEMTILHKFLRR